MIHNNGRPSLRFVKTSLPIALLIAIVLSGIACSQESVQQASTPEKISIAYATTPSACLVQIAFAKGYYAQEGLDATPQPHAFGKLALKSVTDGKADLATVADTPIMFSVMGGKKISILGVIQTSNRNTAIIARQDHGITRPSDLQGKKICVTRGTTSDFFVEAFMTIHHIDSKQVIIIDLKPDDMAEALGTGWVDAAAAFNPVLGQLQSELGDKGKTFYDETIYTEYFCLTAAQDYVRKHPEAVRKVLRALVKSETFVRDHPEESRRLIADFIKVDKNLIDRSWPVLTSRLILDQGLLVNLEDQARWAMKNNFVGKGVMPNYLDFIYMDGLQAIKPEAVRIIH